MTTMNVRCCCEPGLVLGRLRLREPLATGQLLTLAIDRRSFVVQRAYGQRSEIDETRIWQETAINSNHTDVEYWRTVPGFELVCDVPPTITQPTRPEEATCSN